MKTITASILLLFLLVAAPAYAKETHARASAAVFPVHVSLAATVEAPSAASSSSSTTAASSTAPASAPFSAPMPEPTATASSSASASTSTATSSAASMGSGAATPAAISSPGGIYSLTHRFSTETTRLLLELAIALGVSGYLLAEAPSVRLALNRVWG